MCYVTIHQIVNAGYHCENCKDEKKIQANDEYKYVDYKQWIEILVPKKKKDSDNEDNVDKETFSKNLRIISERVERGVVLEKLKGDMTTILHHINTKKTQASEIQQTKQILPKESFKLTMQWLILVSTKMRFKVPFGEEVVLTYLQQP